MKIRKYAVNRRAYAAHRVSAAVDRLIVVDSADEKRSASWWVQAWNLVAGLDDERQLDRGRNV